MSQNILITGCNGYIGCMLAHYLKKRGHSVRGIDNRLYPENFRIPGFSYQVEGVEYRIKDIRDMTVDDFDGIDTLVHLAGLSNDPLGDLNDRVTRGINVYGTVEVASQAKKCGVEKLIFASSCSVYGFIPLESP
nr:NAD(P)-dependent oxidoreductase [bacterium]